MSRSYYKTLKNVSAPSNDMVGTDNQAFRNKIEDSVGQSSACTHISLQASAYDLRFSVHFRGQNVIKEGHE